MTITPAEMELIRRHRIEYAIECLRRFVKALPPIGAQRLTLERCEHIADTDQLGITLVLESVE